MSDGYDHSTFEGYLRDYLRWFLFLVLVLGSIGAFAFLAAKPPTPVEQTAMPGQDAAQASIPMP